MQESSHKIPSFYARSVRSITTIKEFQFEDSARKSERQNQAGKWHDEQD